VLPNIYYVISNTIASTKLTFTPLHFASVGHGSSFCWWFHHGWHVLASWDIQGCIFFYNPPPWGGGKESKGLRAREENQRRVEKNGKAEGKEEKNFRG
jgi:hypothetical protein